MIYLLNPETTCHSARTSSALTHGRVGMTVSLDAHVPFCANELRLFAILGHQEGKAQAVSQGQVQPIEPILDVVLGSASGSELRVGVSQEEQDASQGMTELHGFRWSMGHCGLVDGGPAPIPRVIAQ